MRAQQENLGSFLLFKKIQHTVGFFLGVNVNFFYKKKITVEVNTAMCRYLCQFVMEKVYGT